ncbi:Bll0064 protein [Brevundimonas diminuta 3F5N]|uniref:Bll0064 protein n=1 Tax=Brevundimonas diminuta 3F5N TaxID=1255603 RepID=A0A1R4G1R6_BREDI|nr:toprim domain-containing protein [Brevundimonas diminuta]SJM62116.1 Bll0064 protein [Brevundimonas diminuta 3F5N]
MTCPLNRILSLREIVAALGGDLHHGGQGANVPAPGHSAADRSVSLLLDRDRLVIHGFGSADWRAVRTHLHGLGLIDAAGRMTGASGAVSNREAASPRPPPRSRIAVAQALWTEGLPLAEGDLCDRYFRLRGVRLRSASEDLRRHPAAPVSVFRQTGLTCPALMAAIRTPDGAISAVEIAYLDRDGRAARRLRLPRKTVGSIPAGVAVRLSPPEAEIVVGEGVATTLSAMARFDLPGWALLSAGNLARWSPPEGVRRVLIAGDRGPAGEMAAAKLCFRLRAEGAAARICLPPAPCGDWNDVAVADREEKEGRGGAPDERG